MRWPWIWGDWWGGEYSIKWSEVIDFWGVRKGLMLVWWVLATCPIVFDFFMAFPFCLLNHETFGALQVIVLFKPRNIIDTSTQIVVYLLLFKQEIWSRVEFFIYLLRVGMLCGDKLILCKSFYSWHHCKCLHNINKAWNVHEVVDF